MSTWIHLYQGLPEERTVTINAESLMGTDAILSTKAADESDDHKRAGRGKITIERSQRLRDKRYAATCDLRSGIVPSPFDGPACLRESIPPDGLR